MMGVVADEEFDALYRAEPEEFTARRAELVAAAKKRGDTATAKLISAARKPTTAAWVVNRLVREHPETRDRLRDLADQLRTAHADMDGERIRALSAEQRLLVDHLSRTAFTAAGLSSPPAALRDDVTATLQAAIADPDVAGRLGSLVKAERWSGFGFGESAAVSTSARKVRPKTPPAAPPKKSPVPNPVSGDAADDRTVRRRDLEATRTAIAEARKAKAANDETLLRRHQELAAAKSRHQAAQRTLREAERTLEDAEAAYADAERAGMDAAARIATLRARLEELRA